VAEVSVLQVGDPDAPPKGTSDAELLAFCEQEKRILVTADRATMPACVEEHLHSDRHTWGVFIVGPDASMGRILEELTLVCEASQDTEWIDVYCYLPFFS